MHSIFESFAFVSLLNTFMYFIVFKVSEFLFSMLPSQHIMFFLGLFIEEYTLLKLIFFIIQEICNLNFFGNKLGEFTTG